MTAWYAEPLAELHQGDCRPVVAEMPAESVDCVVFSPPFFGLRKYDGVQEQSWADGWAGAWGLEPSVEMWVAHTVEVMQAVKRVLKPSGICWLEVGDSYAGGGPHHGDNNVGISGSNKGSKAGVDRINLPGLKPKDLCLVPERLALALQASGWWVRSRIVWAKPNPMPESTNDRPTKSHSTIWMLTKAADYYFDQEAVREPQSPLTLQMHKDGKRVRSQSIDHKREAAGETSRMGTAFTYALPSGRNLRDVWTFPTQPFGYELCQSCGQIYTAAQFGRLPTKGKSHGPGKYWEYETEDYTEDFGKLCRCGASDFLSHFATFPEALPTRCILASTSEAGCCPKCGKPWERVIEKQAIPHDGKTGSVYPEGSTAHRLALVRQAARERGNDHDNPFPGVQTLGWAPTCACGLPQAENVPATVLDVCSGSGTTVLAAKKLGRRAVGIDLSEKYLALSQRRLSEVPLSLGGIT